MSNNANHTLKKFYKAIIYDNSKVEVSDSYEDDGIRYLTLKKCKRETKRQMKLGEADREGPYKAKYYKVTIVRVR